MITSKHLIHLAIVHQGQTLKIKNALNHFQEPITLLFQEAITILDEHYPASLKECFQPPFVLFYQGDLSLLNHSSVSIVGSRLPSEYAINILNKGFSFMNKDKVIVSGGAKGIDGLAHLNSLKSGMKTICVCAHGLNRVYPKEHHHLFESIKAHGLMLSEYPLNTPPLPHHFIARNRIVCALGEKLLVMSGSLKSGTMWSVNFALEMNKEIVTIPHPIDDSRGELCNHLIENGASMLTNVSEFATL